MTITNCVAKATGGTYGGFVVEGAGGPAGAVSAVTLSGNVAQGTAAGPGFKVMNGAYGVTLTGNTARGCGTSGFHILATKGVSLVGNVATGNDESGILIFNSTDFVVTGNICRNNGQDQTQTNLYNGITVWNSGGAVDTGIVALNRCYDDQATKTQQYGVRTLNTIGASVIVGQNIVDGNGTDGQTFSFGGATAPSAVAWKKLTGVSVASTGSGIAHGLPYTPTAIVICMTSAGQVWRSGNSTATTIQLMADSGTRTCDVWVG